jgi:bacteriocin biosynthesis cyclodehydratase domain-containing protein
MAGGPAVQLRPTVEVFPAPAGEVYLLGGSEHVLRGASAAQRAALLALAAGPVTPATLSERVPDLDDAERADLLAFLGEHDLLWERHEDELGASDRVRFDRQLGYLAELGEAGGAEASQRRLREARVHVIGCGGLGTWAAASLACLGVGTLVLVDDDTVALSNLNRQVLFRRADVGRRKVDAAAEALRAFDPALRVVRRAERVGSVQDAAAAIDGADLVIDVADHPPHALARWINAACVAAGIPHITAGQSPPLLRIGPLYVPGGPCLICQERATTAGHPLYPALTRHRELHPTPAVTLGPASAVIGGLLAMEALHALIGHVPAATAGTAVIVDMHTLAVRRERFTRDPECPACGSPPAAAARGAAGLAHGAAAP